MLSYVLYGSVRNRNFSVSDTETGATHRVVEIHSSSHIDEIRPTGRLVRLRTTTVEQYPHDRPYELSAGVFHTTEAHGHAATLALGEGRAGHCDLSLISLDAPHPRTHRTERRPFARAKTRQFAAAVLQRLVEESENTASPTVIEPVGM
ncbi:hypothetical protein [Nocardia blacklockiae]|uniref:hypothetical protein n=1 Tax=Nocardia blacklockiae TaxID=480036 RepID=UPI0018959790|nr:hypothetical protein [Nocardia blacklockiae]MBF6174835.1 hypothetical protein [Nocardia blacklockiae]